MLPKEQVKQDIYSKCIYYDFMLRLFRAYSVHNYVPRSTFSTLTLGLFDYPRLRWNLQVPLVIRTKKVFPLPFLIVHAHPGMVHRSVSACTKLAMSGELWWYIG